MIIRKLIVALEFRNTYGAYFLGRREPAMVFDRRPGMHQEIDDQDGFRLTEEDKQLLRQMKIHTD